MVINKGKLRGIRHKRIRAKIKGTAQRPRFSVFRSNRYVYAQLIDDEKSKTLVSASSQEIKKSRAKTKTQTKVKSKKEKESSTTQRGEKIAVAFEVGKLAAKKALKKNIKKIVFDRGGYKYHGRIKAVAEGAREGGLKF